MSNSNNIDEKHSFSKNDHRRIGQELDLFSFSEYVGSGLALWHPNGAIIRGEIEAFWKKEHQKAGYKYVYSPVVGLKQLSAFACSRTSFFGCSNPQSQSQ